MDHLTQAVRDAVSQENWFAALGLGLTLPDICGRLESPREGSQHRYVRWCDAYLTPRYTREMGPERKSHVFLGGRDTYALRCAVLHEGADEIVNQKAKEALSAFHFVQPPRGGGKIHCNQSNDVLQLQVDVFCWDICDGVHEWMQTVGSKSPAIQSSIAQLMKVESADDGLNF